MAKVYLGLGSNLGDRGGNIRKALVSLERRGIRILRTSRIYETEPVGFSGQPWFFNMAVCAETSLSPQEVLKAISAIEPAIGREKTHRNGPRKIDIDILFYGDLLIDEKGLRIPHPRAHERNFVLAPMNEIAAELVHPSLKKQMRELLKESDDKAIVRPLLAGANQ